MTLGLSKALTQGILMATILIEPLWVNTHRHAEKSQTAKDPYEKVSGFTVPICYIYQTLSSIQNRRGMVKSQCYTPNCVVSERWERVNRVIVSSDPFL